MCLYARNHQCMYQLRTCNFLLNASSILSIFLYYTEQHRHSQAFSDTHKHSLRTTPTLFQTFSLKDYTT